jgi:glycosyltransferase involved in cell wall biosynthesis
MDNTTDVKITFIIPTIGRPTLVNTVACLLNQTNPNWKAIIIFDGIEPTISEVDERIQIIKSPKLGTGHNSAGHVRNFGILEATTEWVAFVDDDDGIKSSYVQVFLNEISSYDTDVIMFRMLGSDGEILPYVNTDTFYCGLVGISFAVKKSIFEAGHIFEPSTLEDYEFLNKLRQNNYKMMISPYLLYFVRNYDVDSNNTVNTDVMSIIANRVFINH